MAEFTEWTEKDPAEVVDYSWDFSELLRTDETVASGTVTAEDGMSATDATAAGTTLTARVAGGTAGQSYDVTFHAVTSTGQHFERTLRISVAEK